MKKIIGSKPTSGFIISKLGISGTHCELTKISQHTYLLLDLNSSNGTFVNGQEIRRAVVSSLDKITLAKGKYVIELKLDDVFKNANPTPTPNPSPKKEILELYDEFAQLEYVWKAYQKALKKLKNKETIKRAGVFLAFGLIPFVGSALAIGISGSITDTEKIKALNDEFKLTWICPNTKCKRYFGVTNSWNYINETHKSCPQCKAKYIKD